MKPHEGTTAIVEQVQFAWVHDGRGLQAVASSASMENARTWYEALKDRIRLESAVNGPAPNAALSYLAFEPNIAVVVWRRNDGPTEGRNSSRALIGPPEILTPELATSLTEWAGWQIPPVNTTLERVPAHALTLREETRQDFADQTRRDPYPALVAAVLARMLAEPGRPVSVIGPGPFKPEVVVWALRECGDRALRDLGASPRWTFSTWEVRHDVQAGQLPEIVFLPEAQGGAMSSVHRVSIDVRRWEATPHDDLARAWFEHRFANGARPADAHKAVVANGPPPASSGVQVIPDHYGSPAVEPGPAVRNGGSEEDAARAKPQRLPAGTGAASGPTASARPGLPGGRAPGGDSEYDPKAAALVAGLAGATTVAEFTAAIGHIANDPRSRGEVRRALLKPDVLSRVTLFVEETASADLAKSLVQALFGPEEDLRLDSRHVSKLIQGQSSALARHLVKLGSQQGDALAGEVGRAAALRLVKQGEPAGAAPRMRWIAERIARRRADRRLGWASVLAAVALLGAAVLGGVLLGGGNDGQAAETVAQLEQLRASVDALPRGQAGQGTSSSLATLPWTVSASAPPGSKVVLVVPDQSDKKLHGVECVPTGGPTAPGFAVWSCNNPPAVNNPGAAKIIAWPPDKLPSNPNGSISPEEVRNGVLLFSQG